MPCVHELYRDADVTRGPVPAEALAYWRKKGLKPSFSYKDVFGKEHDFAFAAAKIMREDVLESLSTELDRAIEQGVPFREWMKQIEPRMQAVGWWAPHDVTDPETGKVARVNPPQRLKLIFDTNMRTARAAGQYERIQRQAKTRPYLLYYLGPSARHREQHVAWHGILLPVDDDFWTYAFPPNGWGCLCGARSVSSREADTLDKEGLLSPNPVPILDDDGLPTGHVEQSKVPVIRKAPDLPLVPWYNDRTGKTELVPKGIDPGFHHTPGRNRELALAP